MSTALAGQKLYPSVSSVFSSVSMDSDETASGMRTATIVPLDHFAQDDDPGLAQLHRTLTQRSTLSEPSIPKSQSSDKDEKFDLERLLKNQLTK
jgi:hypothetical protein